MTSAKENQKPETPQINAMKNYFYITSPIFYPNAELHMGHAYTMTVTDAIARYHRFVGDSTYFLAGADENTSKVVKSAKEHKKDTKEFLDEIVSGFKNLYNELDISYNQFIRTSDQEIHWPGAIEMWNRLEQSGDIYKHQYEGLYCSACEAFYTEKDLINGKCPIHETVPERLLEENYFFNLSKYTDQIKEKIINDELQIIPTSRKNEILALLDRGLEDVSFSRPARTIPWGIPVPNDPNQTMYVWCDALVNYISALGFGRSDHDKFDQFWPANVHVIGKDILRFHAAIWPGMLLSAKLPLPEALLVHGFITSGGKKMSKSLGNVIDPRELIKEYGKEALRYYLIREVSPFEDGDITTERFKDAYNGNLANGLGNLVSRVMKMAESYLPAPVPTDPSYPVEFQEAFERFDIKEASDVIWREIGEMDSYIQENQPFKVYKEDKESAIGMVDELVKRLASVAHMLGPILPETSEKIKSLIKSNKSPEVSLFARKE